MENDALTDHAYDGIQEFDNPLPGWWKWMFIGSIVFSICYVGYYHVGAPGRSPIEKYEVALQLNAKLQFKGIGDLKPDEPTLLRAIHKEDWVRIGKGVFRSNCVSCHGRDGEGKVAPNLTDEAYKNIHKITDFLKVIRDGASNGAMPAWGNRLEPNEIILVAAYVASLRGTEAAGGKGPEGKEIAPWPEPPPEPVKEEEPAKEAGEEG